MTDIPTHADVSDVTVKMTAGPENPKEGIDLRPDGGVHLWLDGTKHRLRRVRPREFRKLREELEDRLDSINIASDDAAKWSEALFARGAEREERGEPRITDEERAEDRRRGRELRNLMEDELAGWWTSVVATLAVGDGDVTLDTEDLPPWLITTQQANDVLNHWRTNPSLSGVL